MKRIYFLAMAVLSLSMTGCLKDEGFDNNETGLKTNNKDRFVAVINAYETRGINIQAVFTTPAEEQIQAFVLSLTGPAYDKDVQVTLAPTPALVADHNAANGTEYEVLPAAAYDLNPTVTIPAGQPYVEVSLRLKKDAVDPTKAYALGLQVASVSDPSVKLPATSKQSLLGILLRNVYDGDYLATGHFEHPTSPRDFETEVSLATIGVNSVSKDLGDLGNTVRINLTINAGNTVSIAPGSGTSGSSATVAAIAGDPVYNNTYDPATHTFWLKYGYPNPGPTRIITEKVTLQ
ncbi:DUF1735 domain-containing protein [Pseudoflavitalea sp. X16]|uniref:BT_3987 domain-containing protein n=1 Tax=Paraflavitalea devenefica TaxID=2716334 RepID=UPI0014238C99|nr:DUF1735 domain-containing protein [Paraflavitalea devenefica]NII27048.1 DUF1735 domain-containing protein [Paraflavitalea devenefica]